MKKQHVKLSDADRKYLESLLAKGKLPAKKFKRATGLLELDRGKTYQAVAETLGVSHVTVSSWRQSYQKQGLKCLEDAPRSGRPIVIDGKQRAKITALASARLLKDTRGGPGGCWPTKSLSWAIAKRFRTPRSARFSKKRAKAAPQQDLVHRQD